MNKEWEKWWIENREILQDGAPCFAAEAAWEASKSYYADKHDTAQPKWLPIESAPKDGTLFLIRYGKTGTIEIKSIINGLVNGIDGLGWYSHWHPLPPTN